MRPLEAPPTLAAQQTAFAAHLRDPASAPPPEGIEARRMQVYRDLFYNSLEGILAGNFPVIRRLRGDAWWHALVRDFYREHRCHTPLFTEIGREFLRWLESREEAGALDPPFLVELAHYEWVELALSLADAEPAPDGLDPEGDLLDGVPVPSPLAWPLAYRWPVHRLGAAHPPPAEAPTQPTCLVVVRDRRDRVGFLEANALTLRLLELLHERPGASGADQLRALAAEAGLACDALLAHGRDILDRLRARDIVLGTAA